MTADFHDELGLPKDVEMELKGEHPAIKEGRQFQQFRSKRRPYLDLLLQGFLTRPVRLDFGEGDSKTFAKLKKEMVSRRHIDFNHSADVVVAAIKRFGDGKVEHYLDLGCGACVMTKLVGERLGIAAAGSDIGEAFESGWDQRPKEVAFATITDAAPLGHVDKKWDVITAIQVLHHIPNVERTLDAIAEGLRPGGLLVLKEHDVWVGWEHTLVDLEHSLYLVQQNDDWRERVPSQYIHCRNWVAWAKLLWDRGLSLVHVGAFGWGRTSYGVTRRCLMVFRKKGAPQ